jgi:hypothetical protein
VRRLLPYPPPTVAWRFVKPLSIPSAERTERGVTQKVRDVGQPAPAIGEEAANFPYPNPVEHVAETGAFGSEPSL